MIKQFSKFSLAGIINTTIGYVIIFGGMALGFSPYASNAAGYSIGLIISFYLNKAFVFSGRVDTHNQFFRFIISFLLAYAANIVALHYFLKLTDSEIAAQLISGVLYLIVMFLFSRFWVFSSDNTS